MNKSIKLNTMYTRLHTTRFLKSHLSVSYLSELVVGKVNNDVGTVPYTT